MAKAKSVPFSATGIVATGSVASYHGYTVVVVTAVAAILIRKGNAVTGQIIDVIPAATAAGTTKYMTDGLSSTGGIFFDLNGGTGTVNVLFQA